MEETSATKFQKSSRSTIFILVILSFEKFEPFKFEILKNDKFEPKFETQNDFNIKSDEYQSCSTH